MVVCAFRKVQTEAAADVSRDEPRGPVEVEGAEGLVVRSGLAPCEPSQSYYC